MQVFALHVRPLQHWSDELHAAPTAWQDDALHTPTQVGFAPQQPAFVAHGWPGAMQFDPVVPPAQTPATHVRPEQQSLVEEHDCPTA